MMKYTVVSICLFIGLMSCTPSEPVVKEITFSGTIGNAIPDTLILRKGDAKEKFAVGEDGIFSGVVKNGEGYYQLGYQKNYANIYLGTGETKMQVDLNDFRKSLSFNGASGSINEYLKHKNDLRQKNKSELGARDLYAKEESECISIIELREKAYNDLLAQSDLPAAFNEIEAKNIKFKIIYDKSIYEGFHGHLTEDDTFKASESLKKQYTNIDFTNEVDFQTVPEYKKVVNSYYTDGDLEECLAKIETVKSGAIKDDVIKTLNSYFLSPGIDDLKENIDKMKTMATSKELIADLDKSYTQMSALVKGETSPGFEFKNIKGTSINLEELKGKNVYIDVWATWCGPCIAEIPHLKDLEKSYHDKNIEFVSISVDTPNAEEKWKNMVAEKDLKGIQLLSDNGWNTEFVQKYLINGIPRFILLDKEGKIVSADAPRPSSDDELTDMINGLL